MHAKFEGGLKIFISKMFHPYRDLFLRRDHFEVRLANSAQWIDDEVSKAVRKKEGLRKKARKILL